MQDTIFTPGLGIFLGAIILFLAVRTLRKKPQPGPTQPPAGGGGSTDEEAPRGPGLPPSGPMAE